MIALDTETTGIDLWHGCKPFFVSACSDAGTLYSWEWQVDPHTRQPQVDRRDIIEIADLLCSDTFVFHNTKFDLRALSTIGVLKLIEIDWDGIHDTLIASHVLNSYEPHGLKDLAIKYCDILDDDQTALNKATVDARRVAKQKGWRYAQPHDPHFPAEKKPGWQYDTWIPSLINPNDPSLREYATLDAIRTIDYWRQCREELNRRDLWGIYEQRRQLLKITWDMETTGVNLLPKKINSEISRYTSLYKSSHQSCIKIIPQRVARHIKINQGQINLNSNKQLQLILYDDKGFGLSPIKHTQEGIATDADTLERLQSQLKPESPEYQFLENLILANRCKKCIEYHQSYLAYGVAHQPPPRTRQQVIARIKATTKSQPINSRHQLPSPGETNVEYSLQPLDQRRSTITANESNYEGGIRRTDSREQLRVCTPPSVSTGNGQQVHRRPNPIARTDRTTIRIHNNINITGTRETRQSTSSPNLQNVGTGRDTSSETRGQTKHKNNEHDTYKRQTIVSVSKEFNLRTVFGPPPGFEWWEFDKSNIELRIWAYSCGNRELIEAFESGVSVHLIIAREIFPKLKRLSDEDAKQTDQYTNVKGGNFAIIYGAGDTTADNAYKSKGAKKRLDARFPESSQFIRRKQQEARDNYERTGLHYIETIGGYPLVVPQREPHKCSNYFVQGSAGWMMGQAMINCDSVLPKECKMIVQVHDSLIFEMPESLAILDQTVGVSECRSVKGNRRGVNTQLKSQIAQAMEEPGIRYNIPYHVDGKRIPFGKSWAEGVLL